MRRFDTYCKLLTLLVMCVCLAIFAQKQTDHFTLHAIAPSHPPLDAVSFIPTPTLYEALDQPYHYYLCGGQTFVFISQDGRFVLKLLKQKLYRPSWLLNHLPLPPFLHRMRDKRNAKRADKWKRDLFSYTQCAAILPEESGLICCHMGSSLGWNHTLRIQDPIGIWHNLELTKTDFLIQRKAETVAERMQKWKAEPKMMEQMFAQILSITGTCIEKGLYNRDPFIPHNCGFVEDSAIQIDLGRFLPGENLDKQRELDRILSPFKNWVAKNYPQHLEILEKEIAKCSGS